MTAIPRLEAKLPGPGLRALGLAVPGIRRVTAQIEPYTAYWNERNQAAMTADGPLLVAVGDSTALGIGASAPDRGYIGLVADGLVDRSGDRWRVVNLAQSGARTGDALDRQLPIADDIGPAEITVCCIGTNDVVWTTDVTGLRTRLRAIVTALPERSIVCRLAGGSSRGRLANRALIGAAGARDLPVVDPWSGSVPPGEPRLAEDRFHPSDATYRIMADAVLATIDRQGLI